MIWMTITLFITSEDSDICNNHIVKETLEGSDTIQQLTLVKFASVCVQLSNHRLRLWQLFCFVDENQ
jgi:hypothetical protein